MGKAEEESAEEIHSCQHRIISLAQRGETVVQKMETGKGAKQMEELIRKQAMLHAIEKCHKKCCRTDSNGDEWIHYETALNELEALPQVQPDEKLEKCRFEYINACRTVTFSTPDTTKKDISDAYAVIRALQPIFGDVAF